MKTFKKALALFLATLMIVSAFAAYSVFATTNDGDEPAPASEPEAQSEEWAEETRGGVTAFYIDDAADFTAFCDNAEANGYYDGKTVKVTANISVSSCQVSNFKGTLDGATENGNATITLNLTGALFATAENATFKNINFAGTVDGGSAAGVAAIVSTLAANSSVEFFNVLADVEVSTTGNYVAGFVANVRNTGIEITIEDCVSSCEISGGSASYGNPAGFVSYVGKGTVTIKRSVFTGSISSSATDCGGFVARSNGGSVILEDCVYAGQMNSGNYSSPLVARVQTSATLTRCVVLGKEGTTTATGYGTLFSAVNGTINATDCYVVANNGASYFSYNNRTDNITIKYGDETVTTSPESIKKLADSNGATLTAANFKGLCPELAANGWVVTTNTVTYANGRTVPEILPATVATMLGRTLATSPVNAEQWHVKDNGDTLDIRFIGSIKEDAAHLAKYDNVGMMIVVKEGDTELVNKQYNAKAVYTSMYTDVAGVEPIIAGEDTYLYTVDMRGFNKDSSYTVTFVAFATYNGVNILDYDGATTITVVSGEIA